MPKSEDCTAAFPYFPLIPTPTWAFVNILTSLAPSPIAKTLPLILLTICYFCLGVHLENTTKGLELYSSLY